MGKSDQWNLTNKIMKPLFNHINGNLFRISENINEIAGGGDEYKITSKEEKYVFNYIIMKIIPLAVQDKYLKFIDHHPAMYSERKYPRITSRDIVKTIKKKTVDIDSISYESVINDYVVFSFFVKKELVMVPGLPNQKDTQKPFIKVGCQGPINDDWKWYDVKDF